MYKQNDVRESRRKKHARVRARLAGSAERPRLAVFRSSAHIYAQVIDDVSRRTLVAASDIDADGKGKSGDKTARAKLVGGLVAKRATAAGIKKVVFDRGGYLYHGRVKALAEAARDAGLEF
ncbi:MAG: 50S ribosomal protein L18 [Chloroflexi bacterium]|nr:50S ribosomal protein L18 [Chloroflexota bacterium]